jgi:hypothetical protein
MAQTKQTKGKPKVEPVSKQSKPGSAVVVGQPQALRTLPEKLGELVAQKHFIEMVEGIYATLMVEGIDYGTPKDQNGKPIFPKPMLYKSGAELLRLYLELQLKTSVDDSKSDYSIPVIRFRVTTDIYDKAGKFLGSGEGVCSSLETKYRYRWFTAQQLPASMKTNMTKMIKKADDNGKTKEVEAIDLEAWINTYGIGSARWTRFGVQVRVESQDIFDQENTILSQAKKRSLADGIKTVTGASRIFLIGQEAIQAASKLKTEADKQNDEIVEGEYKEVEVETAEEQAEKKAEEYNVYRETLKALMVKSGFTTPEGQLDLIRFKKLLQHEYKVNNVNELDEKGREKLLSQMTDFVAEKESK